MREMSAVPCWCRICSCGGQAQRLCSFFFSSRRRHTRFDCDWSSDVCSSDLTGEDSFATREQNLTWASELAPDNRIIAGRWWTAEDFGKPLVSLATEFQESLGLRLGDRLSFDIAGEALEVTVASIRDRKSVG